MTKIAIIGGFLGAGKTTTIIELGKRLSKLGKRIGIITNDQGEMLVDTKIVRDFGFTSTEVLHGCFCCRFSDFIASAQEILEETNPDIILAEPTGSCMDIPATVHEPLRRFYKNFKIAPSIVIVDATSVLKLSEKLFSSTSPMGYLISNQIQQAEILAVNKIDLISSHQFEEVKDILKKLNPTNEILAISAKDGIGLDDLIERILYREYKVCSYPEVDYKIYGAAESELGWFNGEWRVTGKFQVKKFIEEILLLTAQKIEVVNGKIAHIKLYFSDGRNSTKVSMVEDIQFLGKIPDEAEKGDIVINARVKIDPAQLSECILSSLEEAASKHYVKTERVKIESFSPPQPQPSYRFLK